MRSNLFAFLLVPALLAVTFAHPASRRVPSLKEQKANDALKGKYLILLEDKTAAEVSAFSGWLERTHERSLGARNGTSTGIVKETHSQLLGFHMFTGYFDNDTVKAIKNHPDVSQSLF
jgi:hypothetical protein